LHSVHRRTGGLEKPAGDKREAPFVHRRTGGLEIWSQWQRNGLEVHRRTGGLENQTTGATT